MLRELETHWKIPGRSSVMVPLNSCGLRIWSWPLSRRWSMAGFRGVGCRRGCRAHQASARFASSSVALFVGCEVLVDVFGERGE